MWHWARGLAYTRLGEFDRAQIELNVMRAIAATDAMQKLTLASFPQGSTILTLAAHILAGELAGAMGQTEAGIAELEKAVAIQDTLAYIEPPAWFYPARQNLGAALLEAGRAADAESVYREDLRQYPKNGWSLFGLAQSLDAQGKKAEAAKVRAEFDAAWQHADVKLKASRF